MLPPRRQPLFVRAIVAPQAKAEASQRDLEAAQAKFAKHQLSIKEDPVRVAVKNEIAAVFTFANLGGTSTSLGETIDLSDGAHEVISNEAFGR